MKWCLGGNKAKKAKESRKLLTSPSSLQKEGVLLIDSSSSELILKIILFKASKSSTPCLFKCLSYSALVDNSGQEALQMDDRNS